MLTPKWIADLDPKCVTYISLDWDMKNGNKGRGGAWFESGRERCDLGQLLQAQHGRRTPYPYPVVVVISRVLGPRQKRWDVDSVHRGTVKQLIDSITKLGYFVDDSPKWITHVAVTQDDHDRDMGPAIRVMVFEDCYEEVRV